MTTNKIDANETSSHFMRILSYIERVGEVPVNIFNDLGKETRGLDSLEVDKFTVGPKFFHLGSRKREELFKRLMAKSFLDRTKINLKTRDAEKQFKEWEDEAFHPRDIFLGDNERNKYHDEGNFVVECLFINEVIRRYTLGDNEDASDGLGSIEFILQAQRDFLVFDNQLPFYVLEAVFYWAFPTFKHNDDVNFLKLCVNFFGDRMMIPSYEQASSIISHLQHNSSEIKNFLDLIRICHAPMVPRQAPSDPFISTIRKARHLEEFGMVLKPGVDKTVCSLQYLKGVLKIPKLMIDRSSEHLLQNLTEHEMQHYRMDTFIIDYLHFMSKLVNTVEDVETLVHNEILVNNLSKNEDVVVMFKNMAKEARINTRNFYFHGTSEAINAYCQVPRHKWKATLRREFCSTPQRVACCIIVPFFLLLVLIRTVCLVISIIR